MNRFINNPESASKRVAFLEDDKIIGNILNTAMCDAGFEVDWFTAGLDCLKAIKKFHYDVCVLDWMVPDVSGPDVMRVIREHQKSNDLPIIFVTSRAAEEDVIEMLARGADDYIVKPASGAILVARINSLLRRSGHTAPHQERKWGSLRVNFTSKIIYFDDIKVDLTKRELELALFLFDNLERLLTRSHILKVVWQHSPDVDSRKIDVYISGLRKKLMLSSTYGWELTSVYGQGYRLEWLGRNESSARGKTISS